MELTQLSDEEKIELYKKLKMTDMMRAMKNDTMSDFLNEKMSDMTIDTRIERKRRKKKKKKLPPLKTFIEKSSE